MLRKKDIMGARDLTYSLLDKNLMATPVQGSPLSVLNKAVAQTMVLSGESHPANPESLTTREGQLMKTANSADLRGIEVHNVELNAIAKRAAELVANSINHARNVVNPLILDIVESAKDVKESLVNDGLMTRRIIPVEVPAVYNTAFISELVNRHNNLPSDAKPLDMDLAEMLTADITLEDALLIMATRNTRVDESIAELAKENSELVTNLLTGYGLTEKIEQKYGMDFYNNHLAIFSYLYLLGIKNGRNASIDYARLTPEEALAVSNAINYYGYYVNRQLKRFDQDLVEKVLIITDYNYWAGIHVLSQIYMEFLDEGGSNEAILGAMSVNNGNGGARRSDQAKLMANPAVYVELYDRVMRTANAKNRMKTNAAIDQLIISKVSEHVRENYEDPKERKELIDEVVEEVAETPYNHAVDLDAHALRIVCDVLTEDKYDAYSILTGMRAYLKDNPEASVKTAALLATADLVAKWVVGQIQLSPV